MRRFLLLAVLLMTTSIMFAQAATQPDSHPTAEKKDFLIRLQPRATFLKDMTPAEHTQMEEHAAYWQRLFEAGKVMVGGPVLNPDGAWGLVILEVRDEAEARELANGDPTVKSGLQKLAEVTPMRVAWLHGRT